MQRNRTKKNIQMETTKRNYINNPSKKNMILFTLLWLLGIILLTLSTTDFFSESFFQKKYLMIYFLMIGSTLTTAKLYINYWKNKNLNSHKNLEWKSQRNVANFGKALSKFEGKVIQRVSFINILDLKQRIVMLNYSKELEFAKLKNRNVKVGIGQKKSDIENPEI